MHNADDMADLVSKAKARIASSGQGADPGPDEYPSEPPDPNELRIVMRKFRKIMGGSGNPGTVNIDGATRAGWIVASGEVEGYGDVTFHVIMLTNGAMHYTSGELTEDLDLTGKWFLGDSIPALEAKMMDTMAGLIASAGLDWE